MGMEKILVTSITSIFSFLSQVFSESFHGVFVCFRSLLLVAHLSDAPRRRLVVTTGGGGGGLLEIV